jgi:hypothetical protein
VGALPADLIPKGGTPIGTEAAGDAVVQAIGRATP